MNPIRLGACVVAALVIACLEAAAAREIAVSPAGTPEGDGRVTKPLDIRTALSIQSPARAGDTLLLLAGTYEGEKRPDASSRVPFGIAVSGEKDRPVRIRPAGGASVHLNGCVSITGSYVELTGLEIGDADWLPTAPARRAAATVVVKDARGVKLVNCNIFGGLGGGVRADVTAVDLELYGCLIHDFGYLVQKPMPMAMEDIRFAVAGGGDGITTANREGTKTLAHNLIYRGGGGNVHLSTFSVGYDFIGNVSFLSKAYKTNENMDSFPICSNYQRGAPVPMDRLRLIDNVAYQPVDISSWRSNLRLISYRPEVVNVHAVAKGNLLMGSANALALTRWQRLEVTSNTVWATRSLVTVNLTDKATAGELKGWTVDHNTYFDTGQVDAFRHGRSEDTTFAGWRKLGFDVNGRLLPGRNGRPTGTVVRLFPNKHERGRAHVAVFNWDGLERVEVDLSQALMKGQRFAVYNCLDIAGTIGAATPILEAVYGGGEVSLPMRGDPMSPDFDAFLVLPRAEP